MCLDWSRYMAALKHWKPLKAGKFKNDQTTLIPKIPRAELSWFCLVHNVLAGFYFAKTECAKISTQLNIIKLESWIQSLHSKIKAVSSDWNQNHFTTITAEIFKSLFLFQPSSHHPFRSQSLVTLTVTTDKSFTRVNLAKKWKSHASWNMCLNTKKSIQKPPQWFSKIRSVTMNDRNRGGKKALANIPE